jgi:hypothetical protein
MSSTTSDEELARVILDVVAQSHCSSPEMHKPVRHGITVGPPDQVIQKTAPDLEVVPWARLRQAALATGWRTALSGSAPGRS